MTQNVLAVYPGTFDPITLGHEDLVRRTAQLFDRVIVAVAIAHHKKTLFTLDERMDMAREALRDCPQVSVEPFEGLVTEDTAARARSMRSSRLNSVFLWWAMATATITRSNICAARRTRSSWPRVMGSKVPG